MAASRKKSQANQALSPYKCYKVRLALSKSNNCKDWLRQSSPQAAQYKEKQENECKDTGLKIYIKYLVTLPKKLRSSTRYFEKAQRHQ